MPKGSFYQSTKMPPREAIAYFRKKGNKITWDWREQLEINNATTFTVARVAKMDVLQDFREIVDEAITEGMTLAEFKKILRPKLQGKGWWPKEERDENGRLIRLGAPRRLEVIYRTNTQSAYMSGRWKFFDSNQDNRPYLEYVAVLDSSTRAAHREMDGKIYAVNDPIWNEWAPPNGFLCRCRLSALTVQEAEDRGISTGRPDADPDEGFDANPGKQQFEPDRTKYDADIWEAGNE